eukprot:scpid77792/ scgid7525/ Cytidine deaminase; Cytidine aminohydrolase
MSLTEDQRSSLIDVCCAAKENAYAPYSKFRVGCGLLASDGQVFSGCNVENASYGGTVCAERVAILKAVSEGVTKFTAIAITCDITDSFVYPCGLCRQVIVEFAPDIPVFLVKPDKTYKMETMLELLPGAFTPVVLNAYTDSQSKSD